MVYFKKKKEEEKRKPEVGKGKRMGLGGLRGEHDCKGNRLGHPAGRGKDGQIERKIL